MVVVNHMHSSLVFAYTRKENWREEDCCLYTKSNAGYGITCHLNVLYVMCQPRFDPCIARVKASALITLTKIQHYFNFYPDPNWPSFVKLLQDWEINDSAAECAPFSSIRNKMLYYLLFYLASAYSIQCSAFTTWLKIKSKKMHFYSLNVVDWKKKWF